MRIGLVSDTHGLLRPQAVAFLAGSNYIVHAGDVGSEAVLESLTELAPLTVVRGNVDHGDWAQRLRDTEDLEVQGVRLRVIHDIDELALDPAGKRVNVVVSGHSHQPRVEPRGEILFVNPGSAGPRRFRLPIAAGELIIDNGRVWARIVDLETGRDLRMS